MIPAETVDEILTDIEVVDVGDGPVVALAHGAGGGVRENFAAVIDQRPRTHRFVGPYYPGTAGSAMPSGPLDIAMLADQVVAAGVRAGADKFPVIGISLGAAVAVTAAARHPEHVSALVLTVGVAHRDAQIAAFTTLWSTLAAHEEWDALAALMAYTTGTSDALAAMSDADFADTVTAVRAAYPPGGARHAELAGRVDVTSLFGEIAVPTLVMVGGQDRIVLPATSRAFAQIAGAKVVEYPDAGHIFSPGQAARWANDIREFLRGL